MIEEYQYNPQQSLGSGVIELSQSHRTSRRSWSRSADWPPRGASSGPRGGTQHHKAGAPIRAIQPACPALLARPRQRAVPPPRRPPTSPSPLRPPPLSQLAYQNQACGSDSRARSTRDRGVPAGTEHLLQRARCTGEPFAAILAAGAA